MKYPKSMSDYVKLPKPWIDVPLDTEEMKPTLDLLTAFSKSWALSADTGTARDINGSLISKKDIPQVEPFDAFGTWKLAQNIDTHEQIALLLYRRLEFGSSIDDSKLNPDCILLRLIVLTGITTAYRTEEDESFRSDAPTGITGTDLRAIPLKTIVDAYSAAEYTSAINVNRLMLSPYVPKEVRAEEILSPLPAQYARERWFYLLVAEQYEELESKHHHENTAKMMAALNPEVSESTIRRWITRARKEILLAPADRTRS